MVGWGGERGQMREERGERIEEIGSGDSRE